MIDFLRELGQEQVPWWWKVVWLLVLPFCLLWVGWKLFVFWMEDRLDP